MAAGGLIAVACKDYGLRSTQSSTYVG